jgi:serine/threonine-protein kinase
VPAAAYNELLLGRQFHNLGSKDGSRRAAESFRKAIRLAPRYAPAWAALAFARYGWAYFFAETSADFRAAQEEAFAAAENAIAFDPGSAKGYSARGLLRGAFRYDWAGAQADFERALALSPGTNALLQGRPRDALELFSRTSLEYLRLTGIALAEEALGRRAEADAALPTLVDRFAGITAYQVAQVYSLRGDRDAAFAWLDRASAQRDPGATYAVRPAAQEPAGRRAVRGAAAEDEPARGLERILSTPPGHRVQA